MPLAALWVSDPSYSSFVNTSYSASTHDSVGSKTPIILFARYTYRYPFTKCLLRNCITSAAIAALPSSICFGSNHNLASTTFAIGQLLSPLQELANLASPSATIVRGSGAISRAILLKKRCFF